MKVLKSILLCCVVTPAIAIDSKVRNEVERKAFIEALHRNPSLKEAFKEDDNIELIVPSMEEMRNFFITLTYASFMHIMKMQNKAIEAFQATTTDLKKFDCQHIAYSMKDKLKRVTEQRELNSQVAYTFFESSEGLSIVKSLLGRTSKEQLRSMISIIEEQEQLYHSVSIKIPKYVALLYESWKREIKQEFLKRNQ